MQVKHDSAVTWPFPSAKAPDQKPVVFFIGQAKFID